MLPNHTRTGAQAALLFLHALTHMRSVGPFYLAFALAPFSPLVGVTGRVTVGGPFKVMNLTVGAPWWVF